jgi:hypothetical protein
MAKKYTRLPSPGKANRISSQYMFCWVRTACTAKNTAMMT